MTPASSPNNNQDHIQLETESAPLLIITEICQKVLDLYLCTSVYFNATALTHRLVECGANVNCSLSEYNTTPLHIAALHNHINLVNYLVSKGANIHSKNASGLKPIELTTPHSDLWHILSSLENQ